MKAVMILLTLLLMVVIGIVICSGISSVDENSQTDMSLPATIKSGDATTTQVRPLYLALIPERDIFAQRQRYRALAENIAIHLGQPVELVSLNTYESMIDEMTANRIDGAFVGSMLAVLAHERLGAQILVKPEHPDGVSTYRGVLIVRDDSPITQTTQLASQSVAMVRTTTAGCLFPVYQFQHDGLLKSPQTTPQFRWVGTHDEVIREVLAGTVAAGAVKNLRLDAYLHDHPEVKIRRLATSDEVPDNGLIVRRDMDKTLSSRLKNVLLNMDKDEQGRKALATFGSKRFLDCRIEDYHAVYEMIDGIGSVWDQLGVAGPPVTGHSLPETSSVTGE